MSYVVLARKYRPMRFEDLVGQDHVARTLANAIEAGRVAHAFLFTGVRGVGKTTSARILAKALNCMREPGTVEAGTDPGPTATPCMKCSACQEIANGSDVDVQEIDGASYTGIDEVRKLQDRLPYRPARDRYKIVIVDEVHMLSQHAWNAFLKTLEEPPPHVKFIFATTEVHKVPITILSRVQRFDFKLIPTRLIAERLEAVLAAEKITSDDVAISIIAREAAGSMRDAMSLLDQVIAWNAEKLDGDSVARVLGVASRQVLHQISAALVDGEPSRCLEVVKQLADQGFDMAHVARDLLASLRDLVVAAVCSDPASLLDLADEEQADVLALAKRSNTDDLLRLHQGFSQSFDDVVRSGQPRAALEMLLVRLARRPPLIPIDDLVGRLSGLERRLGGSRTGGPSGGAGAPERGTRAREGGGRPRGASTERPEEPPPGASLGSDEAYEAPTQRLHDTDGDAEAPTERGHPVLRAVPDRGHQPDAPAEASLAMPAAVTDIRQADESPDSGGQPAVTLRAVAPAAAESAAPDPVELETLPEAVMQAFAAILERVREARPELAAFLEHAAPLAVTPQEVRLAWEPGSMFAVTEKDALLVFERACRAHFGSVPTITMERDSQRAACIETLAVRATRAREQRTREAIATAREHPRVTDAIEILGARIKDLKLAE